MIKIEEKALLDAIRISIGSFGLWSPELEEELLKEINSKALSQVDVSGEVCKCINWHPPVARDKGRKSVCSNCNRPRHT